MIYGLAQIEEQIAIDPNATSANIDVTGGLFIRNGGVTSALIRLNVIAAPEIASIEIWLADGTSKRWEAGGGCVFQEHQKNKVETVEPWIRPAPDSGCLSALKCV